MNDLHFYIDDSGTRNPDKKPPAGDIVGDWFALGGILIRSEDEEFARNLHAAFCETWEIQYPLHSSDIRFKSNDFAWLNGLETEELNRFYCELEALVLTIPAIGMACVIDRPGYNARYLEKYGRQRWSLCKTAFSVIVERTAKRAIAEKRRLRIYAERSDKPSETKLLEYYNKLRLEGLPFNNGGDPKYQPLSAENLADTLREFKIKFKTSPMVQMADLYLYPICRSGYVKYSPMVALRANGKLMDSQLEPAEVPLLGIKYSCFELVEAQQSERAAPKYDPCQPLTGTS